MSNGDLWCRHRTPFTSEYKTCEAGIDFRQFSPCAPEHHPCLGKTDTGRGRCAQYSAYTAEEIAAKHARLASIRRVGIIREAITNHIAATGKAKGVVDCPCCGDGTVLFSRSDYNGHIHAACSTPGCAQWME